MTLDAYHEHVYVTECVFGKMKKVQFIDASRQSDTATMPLEDPFCDPNNPSVVPFEQISAAAYRIRDGIVRTPCDVRVGFQFLLGN